MAINSSSSIHLSINMVKMEAGMGMDDLIAYKVIAAICGLFVGIELSLYFKEWIDRRSK